ERVVQDSQPGVRARSGRYLTWLPRSEDATPGENHYKDKPLRRDD
ncbi:MAG: hypothetical protein JWN15_1812, partial [Firmicutes bacterium]|nr:hypothetical protein [Bacillota bacterium]